MLTSSAVLILAGADGAVIAETGVSYNLAFQYLDLSDSLNLYANKATIEVGHEIIPLVIPEW